MKHQQYREWVLSEEPLLPEQQTELNRHLQACPACQGWHQAWSQVRSRLSGAAVVAAPIGFTERFQVKLALAKAGRQRRQAWLVLALSLLGSMALLVLMAYATLTNVAEILAQLLRSSLSLISQLEILGDLAVGFLNFLPSPAVDLMGVSFLVALLGAALALYASLGGLWAAAVFRFAYPNSRS